MTLYDIKIKTLHDSTKVEMVKIYF